MAAVNEMKLVRSIYTYSELAPIVASFCNAWMIIIIIKYWHTLFKLPVSCMYSSTVYST